jgi:hypothetical protein
MEVIPNNQDDNLCESTVSFPLKLFMLIKIEEGAIISWAAHGFVFIISDHKRFLYEIIPRYFKRKSFVYYMRLRFDLQTSCFSFELLDTKMTSFQRQLNLYGFRRINKGDDTGAYFHPKFRRGREEMLAEIKRMSNKDDLESLEEVMSQNHQQPFTASQTKKKAAFGARASQYGRDIAALAHTVSPTAKTKTKRRGKRSLSFDAGAETINKTRKVGRPRNNPLPSPCHNYVRTQESFNNSQTPSFLANGIGATNYASLLNGRLSLADLTYPSMSNKRYMLGNSQSLLSEPHHNAAAVCTGPNTISPDGGECAEEEDEGEEEDAAADDSDLCNGNIPPFLGRLGTSFVYPTDFDSVSVQECDYYAHQQVLHRTSTGRGAASGQKIHGFRPQHFVPLPSLQHPVSVSSTSNSNSSYGDGDGDCDGDCDAEGYEQQVRDQQEHQSTDTMDDLAAFFGVDELWNGFGCDDVTAQVSLDESTMAGGRLESVSALLVAQVPVPVLVPVPTPISVPGGVTSVATTGVAAPLALTIYAPNLLYKNHPLYTGSWGCDSWDNDCDRMENGEAHSRQEQQSVYHPPMSVSFSMERNHQDQSQSAFTIPVLVPKVKSH